MLSMNVAQQANVTEVGTKFAVQHEGEASPGLSIVCC